MSNFAFIAIIMTGHCGLLVTSIQNTTPSPIIAHLYLPAEIKPLLNACAIRPAPMKPTRKLGGITDPADMIL